MFVDQTSLLLALGFAAFALSATLFVTWLSARRDWFILTWSTGAAVLASAFAAFSVYAVTSNYLLGWVSNLLLTSGLVFFYAAACLFIERALPVRRVAILGVLVLTLITIPYTIAFDAVGATLGNLINGLVLAATAHKFWSGRREAPLWITGITALYGLTGLSFVPCAISILVKNPLVLIAPPSGWAEDLNSIVGLVGITGIGALSLALNQARVARRHHEEARTDALTGLVNRRALFDLYGSRTLEANTAILVFDLDHFKAVNDAYGHAIGDEVLRRFALAVKENLRSRDTAARLGGEEFALVMPRATPDLAVLVAERIRALFESEIIQTEKGDLKGTVSAGVAFAESDGEDFDTVLRRADNALYLAKGGGRNRVMSPGLRLVA